MESDAINLFVKSELIKHIKGGMAFVPLSDFINDVPFELVGQRVCGLPYSYYEVFYHIWFAQRDIINFVSADKYRETNWPVDYWPDQSAPQNESDWEELKAAYAHDFSELEKWISDASLVVTHPVKHATHDEQSLLRELLLIVAHTAYHTGQLQIIKRLLQ